MFYNSEEIMELYCELMTALKLQNRDKIELMNSPVYRYGRYINRLKEYFTQPSVLVKKIRATNIASKIRRKYPRITSEEHKISTSDCFSNERIAVYTAIYGMYDTPLEPVWRPDNCDFYILTDQQVNQSSLWKKVEVNSEEFKGLQNNVLKNRYCKMFPYKVSALESYRYTVYIDGNIQVVSDFTELTNRIGKVGIAVHRHSSRDCVYEEADVCRMAHRDSSDNLNRHVNHLRAENFPEHFGMAECNVIARDHYSPLMRTLMEQWWTEFKSFSKRDQLSFPYILFKNGIPIDDVVTLGQNVFNNFALQVVKHN